VLLVLSLLFILKIFFYFFFKKVQKQLIINYYYLFYYYKFKIYINNNNTPLYFILLIILYYYLYFLLLLPIKHTLKFKIIHLARDLSLPTTWLMRVLTYFRKRRIAPLHPTCVKEVNRQHAIKTIVKQKK
jgi:hypothetical protein